MKTYGFESAHLSEALSRASDLLADDVEDLTSYLKEVSGFFPQTAMQVLAIDAKCLRPLDAIITAIPDRLDVYFNDFAANDPRYVRMANWHKSVWRNADLFSVVERSKGALYQEFLVDEKVSRQMGYTSRDGSVLLTTVLLNDEDSGEYDNSLEKPLAQVHHTMRSLFELRSEGLSDLGRQVAYDNRAVFVDGLGRVIHVGRRAEAALRMGWVDVKNTRLVACDADQQRKLDARLEAATTARVLGSEPCKVLLRDQEGGFGGVATVYTLGQAHNIDLFGRQPRAVVILKPNSGDPLELADLREELGLTGAEAALAADLVSGKTVAEHANGRAISSETARGTLKQVFEKVGVSRQPELVRLISRLWDESC